jgi:hypothetical protein
MADVEFRGKVRDRDPESSWEAAASQTRGKVSVVKTAVFALLAAPGHTDESLYAAYLAYCDGHSSMPRVSPQSVRTRRAELVQQGLVKDSGRLGRSERGNKSIIWVTK